MTKREIIPIGSKPRSDDLRRKVNFKRDTTDNGVRDIVEMKIPMIVDDASHVEILETIREPRGKCWATPMDPSNSMVSRSFVQDQY